MEKKKTQPEPPFYKLVQEFVEKISEDYSIEQQNEISSLVRNLLLEARQTKINDLELRLSNAKNDFDSM